MPFSVRVVLAVYRPDPDHFETQIRSLAAQTHPPERVYLVIADRSSGPLAERLTGAAGLDYALVEPDSDLDAVRAFEAGLAAALEDADDDTLIAACDQDDLWHPDRLAAGIEALEKTGADMAHSDARLVDGTGAVIHESMFRFERRRKDPGLRGLLYRNNITGMTLLMRARVGRIALPFPAQSGVHFYHDLWFGLIAAALGGVTLVDRPLVDYRQHGGNVVGAVDRGGRWRLPRWRKLDEVWMRREAASYALARYLAHALYHRMIEAVADGRLKEGQATLAPLRPFLRRYRGGGRIFLDALGLAAHLHGQLARIALGFSVVALGRNFWILREALGPGRQEALDRFDTRLYSLSPGMPPAAPNLPEDRDPGAPDPREQEPAPFQLYTDQRKEPSWTPEFTADGPAVNVLIPTLNPTEIFAGIVTALDIGLGLAERGLNVRFIATDLPVSAFSTSRAFVKRRLSEQAVAAGAADRIELYCGVTGGTVPSHRDDLFIATAWWSAHVADKLIRRHGYTHTRFSYLIQDFEPNFYAWGPEFADAWASYELDFRPVFNTTLIRDYVAAQGFGFAHAPDALAFHPAIDISRYAAGTRPDRAGKPRRLALYGRPEVPRNMYATAIEAVARFTKSLDLTPDDIEIVSVGLRHGPVAVYEKNVVRSLGKLAWEDYPGFLLDCDLGLSLMYSPHPSHPPIEMAASGMRVVTNHFGPKDLSALSPAILSTEATGPAVAEALERAWTMPPVTPAERQIDLGQLGLSPDAMVEQLARALRRELEAES